MSDTDAHLNQVEALAEEFLERHRRGERPSVAEYTAKHPELADQIRTFFPALLLVEDLKPASEDATGPFTGATVAGGGKTLERLGDYRILREVGRGGMGVVYEAEQESLGRRVALKVLAAPTMLEPKQLIRFHREAKAAARLHHTNIVPVFGMGEHEGVHYYVMQFIAGLGLDDVLQELKRLQGQKPTASSNGPSHSTSCELTAAGVAHSLLTGRFTQTQAVDEFDDARTLPVAAQPRSEPIGSSSSVVLPGQSALSAVSESGRQYAQSIARIGVQVADALAYAHEQGTLHRDIKPSNLLLDAHGTVWVTDFGLAKAADHEDLTHTGDIVGTIRYMAPERFEGLCDARSDLYALGLTLYELLAQRPAFDAADRNTLIRLVTQSEPLRLRRRNPVVPRDLETIVHKAIEKDPAHRYAAAAALGDDLRRFLEDRPIAARRVRPGERLVRWARRNKGLAALTVAVFVLLATIALVSSTMAFQIQEKAHDAQRAAQRAKEALSAEARARKQAESAAVKEGDAHKEAEGANAKLMAAQETLRRTLYAAHMNLVQSAWDSDNVARVLQLLKQHRPKAGQSDLRGFEWYYWQRLCHRDLRTWKVSDVSKSSSLPYQPNALISSDARLLAAVVPVAGKSESAIKVWQIDTGKEIASVPGLATGNWHGVFSLDGRRIALAKKIFSAQGETEKAEPTVWDVGTGTVLRTFPVESGSQATVSLSPDGSRMALTVWTRDSNKANFKNGYLQFWDVASGKDLFKWTVSGQVATAVYSPDGTRVAAAVTTTSENQQPDASFLRVWDSATGKEMLSIRASLEEVFGALAFSPDGTRIATIQRSGLESCVVKIWDASSGQELQTVASEPSFFFDVVFSHDGKRLAAFGLTPLVKVWDATAAKAVLTLKGHTSSVSAVAFSGDDTRIYSVGRDGMVKIWDATVHEPSKDQKRASSPFFGEATINPAAGRLAQVSTNFSARKAQVRVLDLENKEVFRETTSFGHSHGLALSPDGTRIALYLHLDSDNSFMIHVWNTTTKHELFHFPVKSRSSLDGVAFSPDGQWIAACVLYADDEKRAQGAEMGVKVWDASLGKELFSIPTPSLTGLGRVAFSRDGKWIAWEGFKGEEGPFSELSQQSVTVWDILQGKVFLILKGPSSSITHVEFSPDGKRLAAGSGTPSEPGEVIIWDATTGETQWTMRGHSGQVESVVFSPDGRRIASAGSSQSTGSGEIKIWDAATGQELLTLKTSGGYGHALAFSLDGFRLYATESPVRDDTMLEVWDATPMPELPDDD